MRNFDRFDNLDVGPMIVHGCFDRLLQYLMMHDLRAQCNHVHVCTPVHNRPYPNKFPTPDLGFHGPWLSSYRYIGCSYILYLTGLIAFGLPSATPQASVVTYLEKGLSVWTPVSTNQVCQSVFWFFSPRQIRVVCLGALEPLISRSMPP